MRNISKKGAVVMIVVWSVIAALLAALLVALIVTGGFSGGGLFGEPKVIATAEMDGGEFDSVEILWKSGKVSVTLSADGRMHLTQRSRYNVQPLDYGVEDGRLTLRENASWGIIFFGIGSRSSDLELQLPEKRYKEFLLSMSSGRSAVQGISADDLRFKLTSGRLEGSGLEAGTLTAEMTSGNMAVSGAKAEALRVELTSGRAELSGSFPSIEGRATSGTAKISTDVLPTHLDGQVTSGKVSFTIPDNTGFTLYCTKSSGKLKSDFALMQSVSDKSHYAYGTDGPSYTGRLTSGTLEILRAG